MNTTSRPRIQTSCFFSDMFLMMLPLMKSMVRVEDDVSTSDASPINCGALCMIISLVIVPVVSLFTPAVPNAQCERYERSARECAMRTLRALFA